MGCKGQARRGCPSALGRVAADGGGVDLYSKYVLLLLKGNCSHIFQHAHLGGVRNWRPWFGFGLPRKSEEPPDFCGKCTIISWVAYFFGRGQSPASFFNPRVMALKQQKGQMVSLNPPPCPLCKPGVNPFERVGVLSKCRPLFWLVFQGNQKDMQGQV